MKRERWWLITILAIGLLLRCINLQTRSIQYDDAFSITLARQSLTAIVPGTAADTMPPLYYFMLHFWMLISNELWHLRLLSVLFSLASVALVADTVKRLTHPAAGLAAAFLTAISPLHIYHAQDIRMYAPLAFFQLAYLNCFVRLLSPSATAASRRWQWAGLILAATLAMYTHNLAIFGLVVAPFYLLLRRQWRPLRNLILALAAVGLLTLPWLLLIPGQIGKIQHAFWTPSPGLVEIFQAIIIFTTNLPLTPTGLVISAVLSVQMLIVIALETGRRLKEQPGLQFLMALALLPPALLFCVSYLMRPVFVPRGFLVSSAGYLGLAGWVMVRNWPKSIGPLVAACFIAAAAIGLPYQLAYREFPRSPFAEAMQSLQTRVGPSDVILHDNKLSYFPCQYYAPQLPQVFLPDAPGSSNDTLALASQQAMNIYPAPDLPGAVAGAQHIYFVVFKQTIAEYSGSGHPVLNQLVRNYNLTGLEVFNDLEVYTFER